MGYIYLIGEYEHGDLYKIGVTKHSNIEKRISELQTGNANEMYLKTSFQSKYPYKLEKMLHRRFNSSKVMNEWFALTNEDVKNFTQICEDFESTLDALENTTLYLNKKCDLFS
jgi:hypothetical protein